ncbi:N-acetyltransferase GCN5 [Sarocladium strictum]
MDVTIRLAKPADLKAIDQIIYDAYHHYIPRMGMTPGPMLDDYAPMIASNSIHVAEDTNNNVLGLVAVYPEPETTDSMILSNLAVAPQAQGAGLGRKLMEFAEKQAVESGYKFMKLYTNEAMTENIVIYGKKGYVETHRAVERGLRRVFMTKQLQPDN